MTSFGNFFKALMGDKFRSTNFILLINIIAILVSAAWTAIDGNFDKGTMFQYAFSWSWLAILVIFIRLTVLQERVYVRDSYRLIPISDTKFYLTNLASSFLSLLYAFVIEVILYFATAAINWENYRQAFKMLALMNGQESFGISQLLGIFVAWIVMILAIMILVWDTINLIHLLSRVGSNMLPNAGRRVLTVVVYIVIIWGVLRIVGWVMNLLNNSVNMFANSSDIWGFVLNILVFIVVAAIEAAISIYLLHNWVETVSES